MHGKGCENRHINSAEFDPWMAETICNEILTEKNLKGILVQLDEMCGQWVQNNRNRLAEIDRELRTFKERNSRLYDILESSDVGYDTMDLAPRLRANNEKIRALETQRKLVELEQPPEYNITHNDLKMLSEVLIDIIRTSRDASKVREFFKLFIDKIEMRNDDVMISYRPEALVSSSLDIVLSGEKWLPLPDSNGGPAD